MNKIMASLRRCSAVVLLSVCGAVSAQENLNQEITVAHHEEVRPTDAVKLNITPSVTMPALQNKSLGYGTRQIKIGVPSSIAALAPAAYADTIYRSPYRGYAALGYFPAFNLGASAGYKFIDNDRVRLNGWMQYDGRSYRADMPFAGEGSPFTSVRMRKNIATLGATLHSAVGRESFVDVALDYTFASYNTPSYKVEKETSALIPAMENQNVHRLNIQSLWTMTHGIWDTGIGLKYGHFAYGNHIAGPQAMNPEIPLPDIFNMASAFDPVRENRFAVRAFASAKVLGAQSAGLEMSFSHLANTTCSELRELPYDPVGIYETRGSWGHGLLSLRPYYRTTWKHIVLDLGLNLDFTFNAGKVFHISPAAQASWKPSNFVTLYVKANGGERQNTLATLFDVSPYAMPNLAYRDSHVVLDGEVGVTVGLFKGFYSQLSAGYAVANDWLMPLNLDYYQSVFEKVNMKGYKFHLGLGYRYRSLFEIGGNVEFSPQKADRGYYLWRDRARFVADARLRVTPVEPLDVTVGWEFRGSRKAMTRTMGAFSAEQNMISLGNVNNLSLGATYRLTPRWTLWGSVENLLNHHYALVSMLPSQGVAGLVGASYKF
ncbi:MAG: hypothetical protein K2G01_03795 [Paramuribaculum sp.]|nr:hypothetical protein [Paramuribaculum sp.]